MPTARHIAAAALLFATGCDKTEVQPTEAPTMEPREGLVALAMITDRPVLAVHYVSSDNAHQFNLNGSETAESFQVHRVPAGEYCVRYVTWPTATFDADHLDAGRILCMDVKPGVLNYPGHVQFADGESTLAGSLFGARYVSIPDEFEQQIAANYPKLVPLLPR